jgi:hypothetical protein
VRTPQLRPAGISSFSRASVFQTEGAGSKAPIPDHQTAVAQQTEPPPPTRQTPVQVRAAGPASGCGAAAARSLGVREVALRASFANAGANPASLTRWGCSSFRRAPALQAGGGEGRARQLHHTLPSSISEDTCPSNRKGRGGTGRERHFHAIAQPGRAPRS